MASDKQYFNARTWSALGFNLEQVRFLQDLTDKLNTIEQGAQVNPADAAIAASYHAVVAVVSQAIAEAGTSTDTYRWTPERVKQAIRALSQASDVDFTPAGAIAATTVQAALEELDAEKQAGLETGQNAGASFTLEATAGRTLLIWGSGSWGNDTAAQTVSLNYNGSPIASHPLRHSTSADDRSGLSLVGRVTAVASATCSITVTGGTLYDPVITWMEI